MTVAAAEVPVRAAGAGVRAAVYCRISHDPDGTNLGVARQREDCLALAAARGWTVDPADIFIDNDVSAYSGRERPALRGPARRRVLRCVRCRRGLAP